MEYLDMGLPCLVSFFISLSKTSFSINSNVNNLTLIYSKKLVERMSHFLYLESIVDIYNSF